MTELCRWRNVELLIEDSANSVRYAPKPAVAEPQQRKAFFDACLLKLKDWAYDLPQELRSGSRSTAGTANKKPHVYTLHMVYHTAHLLLVKPFLAPINRYTTELSVVEMAEKAKSICLEAASATSSTARAYRQAFGSFRKSPVTATHCTLSAAVVLVQSQRNDLPINLLEASLEVLGELSTSWDIARRLRSHLLRLCRSKHIALGVLGHCSPDVGADANNMTFGPDKQFAVYSTMYHGPESIFAESLPADDGQDLGNWLDMIDDDFLQSTLEPKF